MLKKFLFFVFFLIFFLKFCFSENILYQHNPYATQSENNNYFNLNYINDENLNSMYSSDLILPNSTVNITYTFNTIYCIDEFKIFWMMIPTFYKIFVGENLNNLVEVYNYYNSFITTDEYYTSYVNDEITELNFCENDLFSKYIRISIINNHTTITHTIIRDIEAYGIDVYNELENIEPQDIPLNSIPEFMVNVMNGNEIRISNNNSCYNTFHLDNYFFSELKEYKLCYKHFEQQHTIKVHTIQDISPKIIHISSFTKMNINLTKLELESHIGLSYYCNGNNIHSISNIIGNEVNLFEQGNEEGLFNVCYKFNNIWGDTDLKIKLVKPIITSLLGCVIMEYKTIDCPTIGGNNMTIIGENLFSYYNYPIIRYGDNIVYNNIHENDTHIYSILPEGTGNNINVSIIFETESESKNLLSYMKPEIQYITGCSNNFPLTQNCPNNNHFHINIIGTNFGLDSSTILIGSSMCSNISHISHTNISCMLEGNRGVNNVVYVIQNRGEISEGKKLLSYQECDKGYEIIDGICVKCKQGYYKNKVGDGMCNLCVDGTYNEGDGNVECKKCVENSISSENRYACYCKEGYYMNEEGNCIMCDNMDFFGNIIYYCKESGLRIQSLQNEDGYWRQNELSTNFYKCREKDYCPMNCIINSTIICKEYHTGILCNFCIDNFAKNNDGECEMCKDNDSRIVSGMFTLFISLYIFIIILSLLLGNKYLNKLTDIDNNEEESEEEEEEEGEDADDLLDAKGYSNDVSSQLLQKLKIMITYLQINTILSVNLNIKWPKFMTKVMNAVRNINLELFDFIGLSYRCSVNFDFYHIFIFKMFMIPITFTLTTLTYFGVKYWGKMRDKQEDFFKIIENRFIYILVLLVFMLYPSVCNTILQIYKCEEIEGIYYLSEDLSIECYDETYDKYAIGGGFMVCLYILGIPLFFYRKLKYYNDNNFLSKKEIVYKYGFMYLGYKDNMWWFEILELMRKTILSASIIYLQESATRIIIGMFVCGMYLLYITYNQPQSKGSDAILSILSATELFLLLFCGLILEVKIDIQDKYDTVAFDGIMFVIFMTLLIVGNYQIIKSLKENNIFSLISKSFNKYYIKIKKHCCQTKEKINEIIDINTMYITRETSI